MLHKLEIPPGVITEDTDYGAGPRWVDCDMVRFRNGKPEKIGGWSKYTTSTLTGVARSIISWRDLTNSDRWIGLGTSKKLYVMKGGTLTDISPLDESGTLGADPITTTDGSATVSIADTSHGRAVGDLVIFSGANAVNNITIDGEYAVDSVTDANNYKIVDDETANAAGAGGGSSVAFKYIVPVGPDASFFGFGWGVGTWNLSTWGTNRTTSNVSIDMGTWALSMWGEDLVANIKGKGIFKWDTSVGTGTRASKIANAPVCNFMLVSPTDRHMVAFGAHDGVAQDPLLVRWSDQEDHDQWTPAAGNSSGDMRLQDGSRIVGALRTRGTIIILTDNALYAMDLIGGNDVFAFNRVASNCGLVGPHAILEYNGVLFWMGQKDFYIYDGVTRPIPCPVRNKVFDDISINQEDQVYAAISKAFHEITWFYCSASATQVDRYVTYNWLEDSWYFGTLGRTVWIDTNYLSSKPIATDDSGNIYSQDTGTSADGAGMTAYIESGASELSSGDEFMYVDRIIPDFDMTGSISITLKFRRYPQDSEIITKGPYTITPTTKKVDMRGRGRQMVIRIESNNAIDDWGVGTPRLRLQSDGGR